MGEIVDLNEHRNKKNILKNKWVIGGMLILLGEIFVAYGIVAG